jgi:uncharacterized Zn finger protein
MWKHQCARPKSEEYSPTLLPVKVQEEIKKRKLDKQRLMKCLYCGDVWIEKLDYINGNPVVSQIPVGVDDSSGAKELHWSILD